MNNAEQLTMSAAEIAVLSAARSTLAEMWRRFYMECGTQAAGICAVKADTAEDAIFDLLNHCNTYGGVAMTYEQLYGRPKPDADAEAVTA